MKTLILSMLILALTALPAHANSERKRNAERPDYEAYKKGFFVEMALIPEGPVEIGQPVSMLAKLVNKNNGRAIPESGLMRLHEHTFHLLLVDPTLTDYQHIHPTATDTDGLYTFTFTPKLEGGYRGWADVISSDGKQTFAVADIGTIRGSGIDRKESYEAQVEGYRFTLQFDDPPYVKRERTAIISVTDATGSPVTKLEPIMGTFGHLIGFHDDLRTALHTQPMGAQPTDASARGGPELEFHLKPKEPGFVKMFLQVKIDGRELFVPFGVTVDGKKGSQRPFAFDSIGDIF